MFWVFLIINLNDQCLLLFQLTDNIRGVSSLLIPKCCILCTHSIVIIVLLHHNAWVMAAYLPPQWSSKVESVPYWYGIPIIPYIILQLLYTLTYFQGQWISMDRQDQHERLIFLPALHRLKFSSVCNVNVSSQDLLSQAVRKKSSPED